MNEQAKNLILSIGVLAEVCGEMYRQFVKCGFTSEQAMEVVKAYVVEVANEKPHK